MNMIQKNSLTIYLLYRMMNLAKLNINSSRAVEGMAR